jgi:DNA-binding MarR family transcriptional regulator
MVSDMVTMTRAQIKRILRANRKRRVRPWSLKQIADDLQVHRSMATRAANTPERYPQMRAHIEQVLFDSAKRTV